MPDEYRLPFTDAKTLAAEIWQDAPEYFESLPIALAICETLDS